MRLPKKIIKKSNGQSLIHIYNKLLNEFGNRDWWPAESQFEVVIGAILTQNVSWKNVKKAIDNLKKAKLLDVKKLFESDINEIAPLIKSSRYYNQKAQRIKKFLEFLYNEYDGDLKKMAHEDTFILRAKLLKLNGFGPETVDSVLLYSCDKPVFVVDSYTKRIFSRYGFLNLDDTYDEVQDFFITNLPIDLDIFNDYHAQIVHLGNSICKKDPICNKCPIRIINSKIKCDFYSKKH